MEVRGLIICITAESSSTSPLPYVKVLGSLFAHGSGGGTSPRPFPSRFMMIDRAAVLAARQEEVFSSSTAVHLPAEQLRVSRPCRSKSPRRLSRRLNCMSHLRTPSWSTAEFFNPRNIGKSFLPRTHDTSSKKTQQLLCARVEPLGRYDAAAGIAGALNGSVSITPKALRSWAKTGALPSVMNTSTHPPRVPTRNCNRAGGSANHQRATTVCWFDHAGDGVPKALTYRPAAAADVAYLRGYGSCSWLRPSRPSKGITRLIIRGIGVALTTVALVTETTQIATACQP